MKKELDFELNLKQKYTRFVILYILVFIMAIALYNDTHVLLYALIAAISITATLISFIMGKNKKIHFEGDKIICSDMFGNETEHDISELSYRKFDVAYRSGRYSPSVGIIKNYKFFINNKELITINAKIFSIIEVKIIEDIIKSKKIKEHNDNIIETTGNDIQIKIRASRGVMISYLLAGILFAYISAIMIIIFVEALEIELFIISLLSVLVTVYFLREFTKLKNSEIVYVKNKGFYKGKSEKEKYYSFKDIKEYNLKKHFINDVYREIILFMNDKTTITLTNDCYGFFEVLDGLKIER